jgi:DNA-directed RNA polymerase specialized sigma24 family protein
LKTEDKTITGEAFDRLLAALDTDRDRAGEQYELLRSKLGAFFRWRGMESPEDLADRTLDVAARRLSEGEPIQNITGYCVGVARMMLRKRQYEQQRARTALDELEMAFAKVDPVEEDPRTHCFDRCLQQMAAADRDLILQYYIGEQREKIQTRRELAGRLGIPLNALRIRAFRIRTKLEAAVRECIQRLAAGTHG